MNYLPLFPKDYHLQLLLQEEQIAYYILSQLHHYKSDIHLPKDTLLRIFQAIFLKKDELILDAIRRLYRIGLEHLNLIFNEQQLSGDFHQSLDYLYSSLCYLPIWEFHLDKCKSISIPQWLDSCWQLVEFEIHSLDITPNNFLANEYDRAYCYGLIAKNHNTYPMIIFSGTTYPMGAGALNYFKADLEAFRSVGESLFKTAKPKIEKWIHQHDIKKINVLGLSLGGAMSLQFSLELADKVNQAFALNPPGLYELASTVDTTPKVRVLIQNQDIVSKFGLWHPHWQIEQLTSKDNIPFQSSHMDHMLIYSSFIKKDYKAVTAQTLNQNNKWRNLFIFKGLRNLTYLFVMLPAYYVIIPAIRWLIQEKWFVLSTLVSLSLGITLLSSLTLGALISECIQWKESNTYKAFELISSKNNSIKLTFLGFFLLSFIPIMMQAWLLAPLTIYFGSMLTLMIDKYLENIDKVNETLTPA